MTMLQAAGGVAGCSNTITGRIFKSSPLHEKSSASDLWDKTMDFDEVDYRAYYNQHAAPFLTGKNEQSDRYFVNQAKETHIYGVNNALNKLLADALTMLHTVQFNPTAEHFLRFGVMRRMRMLTSSFRGFQNIIMPNRTVPLTLEQSDQVCQHLNAIYIDILGLLDNYAWTMVHHAGGEKTRSAKPMAVGLFKESFAKDSALAATSEALAPYSDWEEDVKSRRNPAAHRMPLYVPSASYTDAEQLEYARYDREISAALRAQEFEKLAELEAAQQRVGTFLSVFLHDPGEKIMDIYPTVPHDLGQLIKIGRIVHAFLQQAG